MHDSIPDIARRFLIPMHFDRGLQFVRGEGAKLYASDGKEYLDFMSQYGAACLGYSHPSLSKVLQRQFDALHAAHWSFWNEPKSLLAKKLVELAKGNEESLSKAAFFSTGTECVEAAIKFARVFTGRSQVISFHRGYHGRTMGSLSATPIKQYQEPYLPLLPGFRAVSYNDFDAVLGAVSDDTAAILLEPIQGEAGIFPAEEAFLRNVRELCSHKGIVLIFDEVQTGMGRTGKWFCFQHFGTVPDILCVSKALGGGFPVGAVLVHKSISEAIPKGACGSTFGGNPLAAALALEVIRVIEEEGLLELVQEQGRYLMNALQETSRDRVREVRGMGYMIGVEFKEKAGKYVQALQEKGFLVLTSSSSTTIRILPPYTIDRSEVDLFLDAFRSVLS